MYVCMYVCVCMCVYIYIYVDRILWVLTTLCENSQMMLIGFERDMVCYDIC